MHSSTSHSNRRLSRRTCALLLTALGVWAACAFYSVRLNPETVFFSQGEAIKNAWAGKMTREYGAKVVVFGGSSCLFSIDGERMLHKFNLPVVNDGRFAAFGACLMAEAELRRLQRGDTLIVALEPELLTEPLSQTSSALQFSLSQGHPEWALHPVLGVGGVNGFDFAAGLRPGGYHAFTMLGKIAVGRPLYRYQLSDYRASGWAQTEERRAITGQMASGDALSGDAILLLRRLRDWCQEHGVRSAYSMPWAWTAPAAQRDCRRRNIHFLVQMATILPVLKDPRLGADPDQDDFADANWHLTASAAQLRTDELAQQILTWNVWTVEELLALEKTP